ncbi:mucin-2-like [Aphis craccivora]|uniref:Mucin-2-like n=1 Tax=Aphis craccivora TaxID=307492 RepID=A0A6G0XZP4_APHCR|nr:mucin-2-like [Aphis craccivora]
MDNRRMSTNPLKQAAELLERSQQLLQVANVEAAVHATTTARVRRMPTAELRRDPVLWAAYTRGWDDRTAVFRRATNVNPTTAVTTRSRSLRRPAQPAGAPRPPPTPPSARLLRPPP